MASRGSEVQHGLYLAQRPFVLTWPLRAQRSSEPYVDFKNDDAPFGGESNCNISIVLLLNMTLRVQRFYKDTIIGGMSVYNFTVTTIGPKRNKREMIILAGLRRRLFASSTNVMRKPQRRRYNPGRLA